MSETNELALVDSEWFTQWGERPVVGVVDVFDGHMVTKYVGTCDAKQPYNEAWREIARFGAKIGDMTAAEYERKVGPLPWIKKA